MAMMHMTLRNIGVLLAVVVLSACTTVPVQLQGEYADLTPARVDPAVFGSQVRWGGVIIDAMNKPDHTCFEVLSRELDKYLRPRIEDRTAGRFIACKGGFYDPEVFARGREVTVTGRIRAIEERSIDDFQYRYPVLDLDELVLWEVRQEIMVIDNYYDPFWYPYYWGDPYWGRYPYYRSRYPMGGHSTVRTRTLLPDPAETGPQQ